MTPLVAADALHASVLRVRSDMRPRDCASPVGAVVYAVFGDPPANSDEEPFLGLVASHDVGGLANRIFADLLPGRPYPTVAPETPLEVVLTRMNGSEAVAVLGVGERFVGAITRTSLFSALLRRERSLLDESTQLRRMIEQTHERIRESHGRTLKLLATGATLPDVLTALVRTIEQQFSAGPCSVLIVDADGKRLRSGAAPSLPEEYTRAVDGIAIGPCVGSCGTAAHRRELVVVEDIETDPLWEHCRHLALPHGLRACWSQPIFSSDHRVLGTFAMYARSRYAPSEADLRLITTAAHVAGIAIERTRAEEDLRVKNQQLAAVTEAMTVFLDTRSWREASRRLLRCAIAQTASEYGFIGVVVNGPVLRVFAHEGLVWDQAVGRELHDEAERIYREAGYLDFAKLDNLFGLVITSGDPVVSNDPSHDPRSAGLPPGHPPLRSFLGVPVTREGEVVGMIGLANRAGGYGSSEQARIEILRQAAGVLFDGYRGELKEAELDEQRRQAELALRASEHRLRSIVAASADGIIAITERGVIESFNPAAERIFGYTTAEVVGRNVTMLMTEPDQSSHAEYLRRYLSTGRGRIIGVGPREVVGRRKDGSTFPLDLAVSEVHLHDGRRFVGIARDITERKHAQERLDRLAHFDSITGLPNRILFHDRLSQNAINAARHNRVVAVMFLDLDRFKTINDTLGHAVGDSVLKAVADRLNQCVRPGDTVARLGGDEYAIILADMAHAEDAAGVARKILDEFSRPFRAGHHELYTTASIGITLYPTDDDRVEHLIKNADAAMYRAKESGRNTYRFYTADMNARAIERLDLETQLRGAQERGEFLLHYQPQIELTTGKIVGVEALVRWQHPDRGMIPPAKFVPLAEETGLIVPIGEWVLRTAAAQAKAWQDAGLSPVRIAVNVSARQVRQPEFAPTVARVLHEVGLSPASLEIEVTESLLVEHDRAVLARFAELHEMGITFSIDDFGTGYSSLSYLTRFPIDTLKIDRAFVQDVAADAQHAAIAAAIISLAHNLRLRVVAEGVESEGQAAFLRSLGCEAAQGYLYSRPLRAEAVELLLRRGSLAAC